jgi:hypothetical protein
MPLHFAVWESQREAAQVRVPNTAMCAARPCHVRGLDNPDGKGICAHVVQVLIAAKCRLNAKSHSDRYAPQLRARWLLPVANRQSHGFTDGCPDGRCAPAARSVRLAAR